MDNLLPTGRHLLRVSFINRITNLCTIITKENKTEKNCIISHAQNTTALHPNAFLTGIHWFLVKNKGETDLPSENDCKVNYKLLSHYQYFFINRTPIHEHQTYARLYHF
jgi:hypothetical protein